MLALAVAFAQPLAATNALGQAGNRMPHRGAILVQAVDTAINPLAAEVVLPAFGLGVRLSDEGVVLLLNIPDGTYLIQVRQIGYRPDWRFVRITGDTARLEFILPPADIRSGPAPGIAESRLRDFMRRVFQMERASFITRSEIDRRRPRNLAALLSRVPEITIDRSGPGPARIRWSRSALPQCRSGMLLFVDGMIPLSEFSGPSEPATERRSARGVRPERTALGATLGGRSAPFPNPLSSQDVVGVGAAASSGPSDRGRHVSPLDWLPIGLVGGVELYPTIADVPPEFRIAGSECGAVVVWTVRR
jgi:hypothetical protein